MRFSVALYSGIMKMLVIFTMDYDKIIVLHKCFVGIWNDASYFEVLKVTKLQKSETESNDKLDMLCVRYCLVWNGRETGGR